MSDPEMPSITVRFHGDGMLALLDQMIDQRQFLMMSLDHETVLKRTYRGRKVKICAALIVIDDEGGEA